MSDGYNGWKNYETWTVSLLVDNDEGWQAERDELLGEWLTKAIDENDDKNGALCDVAQNIREWIEEGVDQVLGDGRDGCGWVAMAAQLVHGALSDVDWYELADNWTDHRDEWKQAEEVDAPATT